MGCMIQLYDLRFYPLIAQYGVGRALNSTTVAYIIVTTVRNLTTDVFNLK